MTTHELARVWGVTRNLAGRRAGRWEKKLGIKRLKSRAPSGQLMAAYSKLDAERIIRAHRESEARRKLNTEKRKKKADAIEWEIGTAKRHDVITIFEMQKNLGTSREHVGKIAQRLEDELGVPRVNARSDSTQRIIAYKRTDGERIIEAYRAKQTAKDARREANEIRKKEREAIPQPPAPTSKRELFYLIDLLPGTPGGFKIGWTSDIEERKRGFRTTNPELRLVKTWPCDRERDKGAMDYLFRFEGLEQVRSTETFRTQDLDGVISRIDQFFESRPGK